MKKLSIITGALVVLLIQVGTLQSQPRISVEPLRIVTDLFCWDIAVYAINISNEGNARLDFRIETVYLVQAEGWVSIDPNEGQLQPDDEMDVDCTINVWDLDPGSYEAELHIHNNDPDNGNVVVSIFWEIGGVPDIVIVWEEDFGYPDELNWNLAYENLLAGNSYEIIIEISNNGMRDLEIDGIFCELECFVGEPSQLLLRPDESEEIVVTLSAPDDPGEFEATLVILSNDPDEDVFHIRLRAESVSPSIELNLNPGWNLISSPVDPEERDIPTLFAELTEEGSLNMVKDGAGRFYLPEFNYNNIPFWNYREAYLVKMAEGDTLNIFGEPVDPDAPIPLENGWNFVAYFPEEEVEAPVAFGNIEQVLLIGKDGRGRFYAPVWDYNNMPQLRRGSGYKVYVEEGVVLRWNVP
ncbi:hypothetical protein HQ587_02300 [bacterium]|nr:hypothetical protein [bacterium]